MMCNRNNVKACCSSTMMMVSLLLLLASATRGTAFLVPLSPMHQHEKGRPALVEAHTRAKWLQASPTSASTSSSVTRFFQTQDFTTAPLIESVLACRNVSEKKNSTHGHHHHHLYQSREYTQRIQQWRQEYATVETYRSKYGTNDDQVWGSWGLPETRFFYISMIDQAMTALLDIAKEEDLGYLAVQARTAIKQYARERSHLPWRWFAKGMDGSRQWAKTGHWSTAGKTYQQLFFEKTAAIIQEQGTRHLTDEELERKVSKRIFKSAGRTNSLVDEWTLTLAALLDHHQQQQLLQQHQRNIIRPQQINNNPSKAVLKALRKAIVWSPVYVELMEFILLHDADQEDNDIETAQQLSSVSRNEQSQEQRQQDLALYADRIRDDLLNRLFLARLQQHLNEQYPSWAKKVKIYSRIKKNKQQQQQNQNRK